MRVLQAVTILALAAAPVAATAAPPLVRPFAPPVVLHGAGGERHAFWRRGDGDHDFWRHHHRQEFVGAVGGGVGEAVEPGPEPAPSPFVVSAPVFVNVTFAPAAGAPPAWTDGPKLIEIGRRAPQHGQLPLVVYGD
ncbi:MAG: hypothetical protein ABSF67_02470 [Roseiarcus sp.]|jgi:hypothetical protein